MGNTGRISENTKVVLLSDDKEIRDKFKVDFGEFLNYKISYNVDEAIKYIKGLKFEELKIFINDVKLYERFKLAFEEEAKNIMVIPNIYVLTEDKKKKNDKKDNNDFYSYKLIKYDEIKSCLKKEITPMKWIEVEESHFTFEYIDSKEKLILPVYYKVLIDKASNNKNALDIYTISLFEKYSKGNKEIKELSNHIESMYNIPIEILSKYFIRLYSIESNFYRDINNDLRKDHIENNLLFIQTLYEGLNLEALPLAKKKELYRGSLISKHEKEQIEEYLKKKKDYLPCSLAFCKSFLSFTKEKHIAERFLKRAEEKNGLYKVLYILEKDDNIDYNLSTHCDIEHLSAHPYEKEVLFFPFSSFGIKSIIFIKQENRYEINLVYLGSFLKDFEFKKKDIISNSEMKEQFSKSGLIDPKKLENKTNEKIVEEYNDVIIKKVQQKNKTLEKTPENKTFPKSHENIIIAEIEVKDAKNIQLINSYENALKTVHFNNIILNSNEFLNEDDIKSNIEIKIDNKSIPFTYVYKFENEGKYKIKYKFKKKLTKLNHMFYYCNRIKSFDFSKFNIEDVTNMSYMFYGCNSLIDLNLSNFNTQSVTYMKNMFENCCNLTFLNVCKFDTSSVADMQCLFQGCSKLSSLDLSNFGTNSVTDMQNMFRGCASLSNLKTISKFDTKKVADMSSMFEGCSKLISLDLSNYDIKKVIKMNYMFKDCESLSDLKLPTEKTECLTEIKGIFKGCKNLKSISVSNFETEKITDMSKIFQDCKSLKSVDLSKWKTNNVTNVESMFSGCHNLRYLNLMNFNDESIANTNYMFDGCNSLEKEKINFEQNSKIYKVIISKNK